MSNMSNIYDGNTGGQTCYQAYNEGMNGLMFKYAFLYYWCAQTTYRETDNLAVPVAEVVPVVQEGYFRLVFNRDLFPRLTFPGRIMAIAKQVYHIVWEHHTSEYVYHPLWGVATDLACVTTLLSNRFKMAEHPDKENTPLFVTPEWTATKLTEMWAKLSALDPNIPVRVIQPPPLCKSAEYYFNWLLDNVPKDSDMTPEARKALEEITDLAMHNFQALTPEQKQVLRIMSAQTVQQAVSQGGMPGDLSGDIEQLLKALKSVVRWQDKVKRFGNQLGNLVFRTTMNKENKYGGTPRGTFEKSRKLLAFVDVSGSVGDDMVQQFLGEIEGIAATGCTVDLIIVDAAVKDSNVVRNFKRSTDAVYKFTGRGGTDMRLPFYWVRDNQERYDGIIGLTDGYTPFPTREERQNIRTLWIISTNERVPPEAGEVVYLDDEKNLS